MNRRSAAESIEAVHGLLGPHTFYAGSAFSSPASRRSVPGVYLGTDLIRAAETVGLTRSA